MVSTTLKSCSQEAKATTAICVKTNLITRQLVFVENDIVAEHEVSSCLHGADCFLLDYNLPKRIDVVMCT